MSWNNVMPPARPACSAFMDACGVTDVACHPGLHRFQRVACAIFMY